VFVDARAQLKNADKEAQVVIDLGLGVFLDLSLSEALKYSQEREHIIKRSVSALTQAISNLQAQITIACQTLSQLKSNPPERTVGTS